MSARIKAIGFLGSMYVITSCVLYEIVIQSVADVSPVLNQISEIEKVLVNSGNLTEINLLLNESDKLYLAIKDDSSNLYLAFQVIKVLCVLNCSFLFQHFVTLIFTKKLGRFYDFPQMIHFSDAALAVSSVMVYDWFSATIQQGLYTDPNLP